MPLSSQTAKQPTALALKQAANWQCMACKRLCRRQNESLDDFARRVGQDIDMIEAHPRRWMLHVTKLHNNDSSIVLGNPIAQQIRSDQPVAVLCGSCHRTYHNYRRWRYRQQQRRQQQEGFGQLTLNDIRLPLAGLQLSLSESVSPYEIVNPQPRRR